VGSTSPISSLDSSAITTKRLFKIISAALLALLVLVSSS